MSQENPYNSPQTQGVAPVDDAETVKGEPRLSTRQATWIVHTQYALRTLYCCLGIFALLALGQLVFIFVALGPDAAFPISDELRLYTTVVDVFRIVLGGWIVLALHRFDLALGQVRMHDAAPMAVQRALRMSRNAWFSLAGAMLIAILGSFAIRLWTAASVAIAR